MLCEITYRVLAGLQEARLRQIANEGWGMTEPKQSIIGSDDLHLAQLACAKRVGLIRGTLSIGLPAFVTGVPDPRAFLHDRFRVVTAFALVLDAICWPAGNVQEILHLREKSGKLLSAVENFRHQLFSALDDTGPVLARLQPASWTCWLVPVCLPFPSVPRFLSECRPRPKAAVG